LYNVNINLRVVMAIVVLTSLALVLGYIVNLQYSGAESFIVNTVSFP